MKKNKDGPADLPLFCDFSCRHASFGKKDVAGACRREQAVYCTLLKKYNNKNNRCLARPV
jgi:hypothetical protein